MPEDTLSRIHFKTVSAEIEGRFFSQHEADQLKDAIDRRIIKDHALRIIAASTWETIQ
jgi:hypothetical protein